MLKLLPQEANGKYQFDGQTVMTRDFQNTFDEDYLFIVIETMKLIRKRVNAGIADYFQVVECNGTRFWVIDDVDHITFLLPENY